MEFGILGPLVVERDGSELPLGGPKQRALLVVLLLHANEIVSRDVIVDALWGEHPPPTAQGTLDTYVSRLRRLLGDDRLGRRAPGYSLRVESEELDLARFELLVTRGRQQLARGAAAEASVTFRSALALWRGPALADVLHEPVAAGQSERLEERRLVALEQRIEADLMVGGTADLVPEVERLVHEQPFRERPLAQLMLALYRSGRQAEALDAFQAGRRRFAHELGLEPSPQLQELQRRILEHDPALAPPSQRVRAWPATSRGRRSRVAVIATAVVAAAVATGVVLGTGGTKQRSVASGSSQLAGLSLGSMRPSRRIVLSTAPGAIASADGSLWLAEPDTGAVLRGDPKADAIVDSVPVGGSPSAIAVGAGSVWSTTVPGEAVTRTDPKTGVITQAVRLGGARAGALAFGAGKLWIADIVDDSLLALDPESGTIDQTLTLDLRPSALTIGDGVIWVASYDSASLEEVDLRTGLPDATIHVGNGPTAIAVARGAIWVANTLDSTVSRIDPDTGSVVATIPVGSRPVAVVVADGSVWVASTRSMTISRIDPQRNAVVQSVRVDGSPTTLAAADGILWTGLSPVVQHRGGTLVLLHTRPITIDPALQFDLLPLQSDSLTHDGLVAYNHAPGAAGIQLVPDLAVGLPTPTVDATTYTFRLRPAIRYSDGSPVHAADFRRAIERLFRLGSSGARLLTQIVGARRCNQSACDLSIGIVTDERARTVTFHLRSPDGEFLDALTGGIASPVPVGTPLHEVSSHPIPGTGPYMIASASRREIRYVRNPFFREWSFAAKPDGNPDEIIMRFGLTPAQEVRAIEQGRADWSADFIPARLLPTLRRRYASQLHPIVIPTTDFFQLNSLLPPFNDVRARQALNYAIDRAAIVRIYGGSDLATPTCQILPTGASGYRRYCPYTRNPTSTGPWTAPNMRKALQLVAASGTRGTPVTVWGWTDDPTISPGVTRYIARVLRRLGYPTRVHLTTHQSPATNDLAKIQLIPSGWGDLPYSFFSNWFSCTGSRNPGWFCDPEIDREIAATQTLETANPIALNARWAHIDRQLVDEAASLPLINEGGLDFVSARVHNYQANPYWGLIADQLWLR